MCTSCTTRKNINNNNARTVETVTCKPVEKENWISTFGTVTAKTKNDISSLVSGTIYKICYQEGDYVEKGKPIIYLRNIQYEIQKIQYQNELNSADANLKLSQLKLAEAENLVRKRLISLNAEKINFDQKYKEYIFENENLRKNENLYQAGGISEKSIEDNRLKVTSLYAELDSLRKNIQINEMGLKEEDLRISGITPSADPSELEKQIIELNTRNEAIALSIAEAQLSNAEQNLKSIQKLMDELVIRSNISGILGVLYFETGEYVKENEKVASILDMSTPQVVVSVQEKELPEIVSGARCHIKLPALKKEFDSEITTVSPFTDFQTGNVNVKIPLLLSEELNGMIKAGMFCECLIEPAEKKWLFCFPASCIVDEDNIPLQVYGIQNNYLVLLETDKFHVKNGFVYTDTDFNMPLVNNPDSSLKEGQYVKAL